MFTGIIKGVCQVSQVISSPRLMRYGILMTPSLILNLEKGASVSIDGVCLTVTAIDALTVWFEVIEETLMRTTLRLLKCGDLVNVERAARFGEEIGGHVLSGHILTTGSVYTIENQENRYVMTLKCLLYWTKYLFPKGYIALNGTSLTLVDVNCTEGLFSVHLIPETLKNTTFTHKKEGDLINIEFDVQTQTIVDTVQRVLNQVAPKSLAN